MAPVVDMNDKNAWDDSSLINSWNAAVKEYEKYHSIHKSGKRLEEVLSEQELKELREDYGGLIEETQSTFNGLLQVENNADHKDTDMIHAHTNGNAQNGHEEAQQQEPTRSEQHPTYAVPAGNLASAMPQAILGTVQDETLKNMMMSWYYAGYYTGLHAGQQQAPKDDHSKQ